MLHAKDKCKEFFFRAAVKKYAQSLNLTGFVKNLTDGSVLICAIGGKEKLIELIELVKHRPGNGRLDNIETFFIVPEIDVDDFEIQY
jgi:acylphosphatase